MALRVSEPRRHLQKRLLLQRGFRAGERRLLDLDQLSTFVASSVQVPTFGQAARLLTRSCGTCHHEDAHKPLSLM